MSHVGSCSRALLAVGFYLAFAMMSPVVAADRPGDVAVQSDIEQIRTLLPTQAHAMVDVEYHMANLWFAAHERNWPLASFYLNETRGRIQWALRLRPVRKLASGQELDLKPLADAIETVGFSSMRAAIDAKELKAMESSYRATLGQCYACHLAAEKPFLRLTVPRRPASDMVQMKP